MRITLVARTRNAYGMPSIVADHCSVCGCSADTHATVRVDHAYQPASVLVQTDYDYPGIASTFGWSVASVAAPWPYRHPNAPCAHDGTDGTIDCPQCGQTATRFIDDAADWIADNDGATADDPGYLS